MLVFTVCFLLMFFFFFFFLRCIDRVRQCLTSELWGGRRACDGEWQQICSLATPIDPVFVTPE